MTLQEMAYFKALYEAHSEDGTIVSLCHPQHLTPQQTANGLLKTLVAALLNDKASLILENQKMSKILKEHGLYDLILED